MDSLDGNQMGGQATSQMTVAKCYDHGDILGLGAPRRLAFQAREQSRRKAGDLDAPVLAGRTDFAPRVGSMSFDFGGLLR
jgi:hypothetical protein